MAYCNLNAVANGTAGEHAMTKATLTISSKTYSAWSLRGWLLCRLAGLEVDEQPVTHDANDRA
ncbi:MAG TPA: hypothetical protein VFF94_02160, partial [Novosphingobium sp.]|nr:hypothetical protein [Novosphingobium sp.]